MRTKVYVIEGLINLLLFHNFWSMWSNKKHTKKHVIRFFPASIAESLEFFDRNVDHLDAKIFEIKCFFVGNLTQSPPPMLLYQIYFDDQSKISVKAFSMSIYSYLHENSRLKCHFDAENYPKCVQRSRQIICGTNYLQCSQNTLLDKKYVSEKL